MIEKIHCISGDTKYTNKQPLMYKFILLNISLVIFEMFTKSFPKITKEAHSAQK